MTRWRHVLIVSGFVLGLGVSAANAQKMYWNTQTEIVSANLDGSDIVVVVSGLSGAMDIALDVPDKKIYWTEPSITSVDRIQRANLDGTQIEELVTSGLNAPYGIALDLGVGKMYWVDGIDRKILRANLDGTSMENLFTTESGPHGVALDLQAAKIYWTMAGGNKIQRASLDGSDVEDLVVDLPLEPVSIALDLGAGKMYYTLADTAFGENPGHIQRANLDGSDVEELITTPPFTQPWGIALDVPAGKLYWADLQGRKIQRANLDGSGVEDVVDTQQQPRGIALDLTPPPVPALSEWGLVLMGLLFVVAGALIFARQAKLDQTDL